MKDTILSVSGRPGLFKLISRGRGILIVETLDEQKKRMSIGMRDRVTSLNDISMYADDDDVALSEIFQNIFKELEGKAAEINIKAATKEELADFMSKALPNYDRERVHDSDIRKLASWYNILVKAGYTDFTEE